MKNSISAKKVTKKYNNFTLNQVDLVVPSGTIVGLVGENGAGKTTLIKAILGIIHTTEGSIELFDGRTLKDAKEDIGVVLDNTFFAEILRVEDINLIMKNVYKKWDTDLFNTYLNDFKIPTNQVIKTLSKGMRKKLEIATALAHHPKLLILDEPTSGLDPVVRSEILDIFLEFIQDEEHSVLLSSHITSDLEHIADYITFIHEGNIVLSEDKNELLENYLIIRCDEDMFNCLEKEDVIRYRKNIYIYDVLVYGRDKIKRKYKDLVIDNASIDDVMLLYIKGVK